MKNKKTYFNLLEILKKYENKFYLKMKNFKIYKLIRNIKIINIKIIINTFYNKIITLYIFKILKDLKIYNKKHI